jgi:hypothetical protein
MTYSGRRLPGRASNQLSGPFFAVSATVWASTAVTNRVTGAILGNNRGLICRESWELLEGTCVIDGH